MRVWRASILSLCTEGTAEKGHSAAHTDQLHAACFQLPWATVHMDTLQSKIQMSHVQTIRQNLACTNSTRELQASITFHAMNFFKYFASS